LNWPHGQFSRHLKGDKMEIRVVLGHASTNPEKHCSDGDSLYVTSSVENILVRLLGIDAFEVKGMSLYYLEESKLLQRLPVPLQEHLKPLLTQKSKGKSTDSHRSNMKSTDSHRSNMKIHPPFPLPMT
jgi:hypothetical protein